MPDTNLLFVFTDQQRADTMAAYGNPLVQMPHLDKLASQSILFERAYVSQPVCTPSRSTIMTGQWPHTTGCIQNNMALRAEIPCVPEMLSRGDYHTAYMGKWHLGDEVFAQHGFDEWVSIDDGYRKYYSADRDPQVKSDYHQYLVGRGYAPQRKGYFGRGDTARLPEEDSKPAYLAEKACRFLRDHKHDPFLLYVGLFEPHSPYFGPRDDQYDPSRIPLPSNFYAPPSADQPLKTRLFRRAYEQNGHSGLALQSESDWKRITANYWGLCSLIDTAVGRILQTLEECHLAENTIVVFTSDHGDMMGSHQLIAKCVMFEEAVRVPFLIRLPGQTARRRIAAPVSQIDLVPTILDLMGEEIPEFLPGRTLRPLWESPSSEKCRPVFIEWNGYNSGIAADTLDGPQVAPELCEGLAKPSRLRKAIADPVRSVVSQGRYKLNCSSEGECELYDLCEDPGETQNLISVPAYRALIEKLFDKIQRWQKRTNDTVTIRIK